VGRQTKPLLLWLDFALTPQDRELRVASARYFRLANTTLAKWALQDVADLKPGALCFEFDHPDQRSLQALQDVKRAYPRLPVLMLTVDHSEALAVWAFRAGVWNYLVRPVAVAEFSENLKALAEIVRCGAPVCPRHLLAPSPPPELSAAPVDAHIAHLQPALHYVRRHFAEKITESEAARRCGMSRFAFSRGFHAAFRMTFRDYVMRARISEARRLLAEGDRPVTDVVFATGFTDGSYFARMFKRHTGVLPSQYAAGMARK
jgi:AraC-like DNA-binding protein